MEHELGVRALGRATGAYCKGMSFAEATKTINERYDTSYTRSAALGRAWRLRLGQDGRAHPSMPTDSRQFQDIAAALANTSA